MGVKVAALAALLAIAAATPGQAAVAGSSEPAGSTFGVWRNPKNSVHVEIKPCPGGACGYVVWATDKAKADARKGGTDNLIGLQLFRNFVQGSDGVWAGKVFVPDLNRTFTGTAEPVGATALRARGCVLFKIICKSQMWTRLDGMADLDLENSAKAAS